MVPTNLNNEEDALYFRDGSLRNPETYVNSLLERIDLYNLQTQKIQKQINLSDQEIKKLVNEIEELHNEN